MSNGLITFNTRTNGISRDMEMAAWRALGASWLLAHNDPELIANAKAEGAQTIYRQDPDGTLPDFQNRSAMQVHAEAFVQTRLEKGADYVYLTNEINSSPDLQAWTRYALEYAQRNHGKALPFSYGTHAARWQWQQSEDNVRWCVEHDVPISLHLYLDNLHDNGAFEWLWLKQKYGGTWVISEFNYIADYTQAERGPLGVQDDEAHAKWLSASLSWLIEKVGQEGLVVCYFALDDWPSSDEGRRSGFGANRRPQTRAKLSELNRAYAYRKGKSAMTTTPVGVPASGRISMTLTTLPGDFINVRFQPSANATDLGDLHLGDQVSLASDLSIADWVYIEKDALKGWVSLQGGNVRFTPTNIFQGPDVTGALAVLQESLKANDEERVRLENAIALLKGAKLPDTPGVTFSA